MAIYPGPDHDYRISKDVPLLDSARPDGWRWAGEIDQVHSISQEADPDWSFTDAAGHTHRYDGDAVPTTKIVSECNAWHRIRRWFSGRPCSCRAMAICAVCGEQVVPGRRPVSFLRMGRMSWTGTLRLGMSEAVELAPFDEVRIEDYFPQFEGAARVGEIQALPSARADVEVEVSLVGEGTIKYRESLDPARSGR